MAALDTSAIVEAEGLIGIALGPRIVNFEFNRVGSSKPTIETNELLQVFVSSKSSTFGLGHVSGRTLPGKGRWCERVVEVQQNLLPWND